MADFTEVCSIPAATYAKDAIAASASAIVSKGHDTFHLTIDRSAFVDPGTVVKATAEYSIDNGKTWTLACSFCAGGPLDLGPAPGGADPSISSMTVSYPHLQKLDVLTRASIVALKGVTTGVSLKTADSGVVVQSAEIPHSVVFDAVGPTANWANANSPVSWTHTPAGTPTAVGLGVGSAAVSAAVSFTPTYGGTSMGTQAATNSWTSVSTFPYRNSIFGLANPSAGAKTVSVAFANNGMYGGAGSLTVTGSDTTTCFSNVNNTQSTGTAVSTNCTSATDELVLDHMFDGQTTTLPSVGGSQTSRWSNRNAGASQTNNGSTQAGAASVTMAWTRSGLSVDDGFGHCVASFKLAAAGGSFNPGWASGATKTIGAVF